jgi:hypothetical protein
MIVTFVIQGCTAGPLCKQYRRAHHTPEVALELNIAQQVKAITLCGREAVADHRKRRCSVPGRAVAHA